MIKDIFNVQAMPWIISIHFYMRLTLSWLTTNLHRITTYVWYVAPIMLRTSYLHTYHVQEPYMSPYDFYFHHPTWLSRSTHWRKNIRVSSGIFKLMENFTENFRTWKILHISGNFPITILYTLTSHIGRTFSPRYFPHMTFSIFH